MSRLLPTQQTLTPLHSMLHNVALNGTLGVISGLGNVAPASLVNVFKLFKVGKFEEAKKAQEAVSIAGELEIKGGVPGMRVSTRSVHAGDVSDFFSCSTVSSSTMATAASQESKLPSQPSRMSD